MVLNLRSQLPKTLSHLVEHSFQLNLDKLGNLAAFSLV